MEFIRYALDSAAIVAMTDVKGTITFVNSKFCEISGYSEKELIGANHRMLRSGRHDVEFFRAMYRQIARGEVWHGEICNRRKDGSLYWVDTTIVPHMSAPGRVDSYTAIRFDITPRKQAEAALRLSEEELKKIVDLDPLTRLPNRRRFQEYIELAALEHAGHGGRVYLGLLDIDTFKEINDSFGHDVGDKLLKTIAQRLSSFASDRVFISRLGGDEFGIIVTRTTEQEAFALFDEALECIREPMEIGSALRRFSSSMGIAILPQHASDPETLFKMADITLYHAKSLGRDRAELFRPELKAVIDQRAAALLEIEDGLRNGEFVLHYQPIVKMASSHLISLEALMRWQHPTRGLLLPAAFIAGLQEPAVRAALGRFMLERVFDDIGCMLAEGIPLRRVAINLTNSDFRSDVFVDRFFELSRERGIDPSRFCVEVTEGMFLGRDHTQVQTGLQRLHAAGVEVALDDFGTGFASLTHLRQLPIDRLKIDRSFIANILTSPEDQAIVHGVINIAHTLGTVVTAEGVETAAQAELLRKMNCDNLQGWLFSKARPVEALPGVIETILARWPGNATAETG